MTAVPLPTRRLIAPVLLASGGAGLLCAGVLAAAWLERNDIGARITMSYLRSRGVAARVKLTRLDAGAVEGSLVIGPPDHPTLVAPHFTAEFAPGPLFSMPRLRQVILIHPRLELDYDGRRIGFRALQPLIDEARRAPKGRAEGLDVAVSNGELRLHTVYGQVLAGVDATITAGMLREADVQLKPAQLTFPGDAARGLSGRIRLRALSDRRYALQGEMTAAVASLGRAALQDVRLDLQAELPFTQGSATPFAGAVQAELRGSAASATAPGVHASRTRVQAKITGAISDGPPTFAGQARAQAQSDRLILAKAGFGDITADATAARLNYGPDHRLDAQVSFRLGASTGLARIASEPVSLSSARMAASGDVHSDRSGASLDVTSSLAVFGALSPVRAKLVAERLAPGPYGADLRPALLKAFAGSNASAPAVRLSGGPKAWRLQFTKPLTLGSAGGAHLVLSDPGAGWMIAGGRTLRGSGVLDLGGGGFPDARLTLTNAIADPENLIANVRVELAGSAGPLRQGKLSFAGGVEARPGAVRLSLARCASLAFASLQTDGPKPSVQSGSTQVCPLSVEPLLAGRDDNWRAALRLQGLAVAAPGADLAIGDGEAELRLSGRRQAVTGEALVAHALVRDTSTPVRFQPLSVSGPVRLADQRLTGGLELGLAQPERALGRLQLTQDIRTGAGGLQLDAPQLAFTPGGLQPAAVLPGLASLGQDVTGPAQATLTLRWRGAALVSSARVRLAGVQLKTAAGLVTGLSTDLTLIRLDPLTSAPNQSLSAERLAAVLPLTDLSASYALDGGALDLGGARAALAGGHVSLDPTRLILTPGATLSGVIRADGVEIGTVLDVLNLSRAVAIEAKVSGALPFSFGPRGLRIADGHFAATGPGRLTVRREALSGATATSGAGAPSNSAIQDFTYQALEDLAFTQLDASVASRPQGRLGVVFHIRGRHDPPVAKVARVNLIDLLRGHAFDRPLALPKGTEVNLTLDSSLNLDELLGAYFGQPTAGSAPVQP